MSVGPVSVPEIVHRPQFVVSLAANQVEIAQQARWAEPLNRAIPRVIAAYLAYSLADARVSAHSDWLRSKVLGVLSDEIAQAIRAYGAPAK